MRYKLIVFDMDGTILDTLEDLADSVNHALQQCDLPTRSLEEVRQFVGNGIRRLIERAVPSGTPSERIDQVHAIFTEHYRVHCADKTRAYDGIPELLAELRNRGYQTAVVSNKADYAVQELCEQYFKGLFDAAVGEREGVRRKPCPDSVLAVLEKLQIDQKDAVYIGDSDVDIATAQNAGMDGIFVSWGFRGKEFLRAHGAQVVADRPEEVLEMIIKDSEI